MLDSDGLISGQAKQRLWRSKPRHSCSEHEVMFATLLIYFVVGCTVGWHAIGTVTEN